MAQSLETLRSSIADSIKGRKLGLTWDAAHTGMDYLVVTRGIPVVITDMTSASTATAVPNNGLVNITGTSLLTSGQTFLLSNPIPGVSVTIMNINAMTSAGSPGSTAMTMIRPSTAFYLISTEGTTVTTINLAANAAITLIGLTTGYYMTQSRTSLAGVIMNGTT